MGDAVVSSAVATRYEDAADEERHKTNPPDHAGVSGKFAVSAGSHVAGKSRNAWRYVAHAALSHCASGSCVQSLADKSAFLAVLMLCA